ncbi:hypothetical protein B4N84_00575, partial [Flavobacterium sp. IR1]
QNNPEVLVIDRLFINAEDLLVAGPDVSVNIQKMSGFEKRGLQIDFLSTAFSYSKTAMELRDLEIRTPESSIAGEIIFDIENGFGKFNDTAEILADFETASISTNDLQPFYGEFGSEQQLDFTTRLEGTLNDFRLHDFRLRGMDRSVLNGELVIQNILA